MPKQKCPIPAANCRCWQRLTNATHIRPVYQSGLTKFCIAASSAASSSSSCFPFPVPLQLIPRLVLGLLRNSHCISSGSIGNKFQFAGLPGRESDSQPGPGSAPWPPSSPSLSVPVSASLGCLATMQCGGKMIKIRLHSGVKLTYIAAIYPFARYTLQMGQHRSRNWLCWRQH